MGPLPATNSAPTTDSAVKARTNSSASSAAAAAADDAVSHSSAAVNGARRAEHAEDPANGGALARGRKTTREASDDDAEGSGDDDKDGGAKGGARKRKRSRKGLDKKYMCQHPDCTKSYSRAEHLYRHQLNHTPKQIYKCDFPDCPRWFVRQDLCARHRERHTTRGSHLQRRDSYAPGYEQGGGGGQDAHASMQATQHPPSAQQHHHHVELSVNTQSYGQRGYENQMSPMGDASLANHHSAGSVPASYAETFHPTPTYSGSADGSGGGSTGPGAGAGEYHLSNGQLHRSNSESHSGYYNNGSVPAPDQSTAAGTRSTSMSSYDPSSRGLNFGFDAGVRYPQSIKSNGQHTVTSPVEQETTQFRRPSTNQIHPPPPPPRAQSNGYSNFVPQQHFPPFSSLPPPVYSSGTQGGGSASAQSPQRYLSGGSNFSGGGAAAADEFAQLLAGDLSMTDVSMFDGDGYTKSPTVMADNFTAWLFNDQVSPGHRRGDSAMLDPNLRLPINNGGLSNTPSADPMAVASILGSTAPGSIISAKKRKALLELIRLRFNGTKHSAVENLKDQIFAGDVDAEGHVLSLRSMQTYIGSYWYHFHDQMPILHRPTFSADNAQNLLLIAVIAIGAANLDKIHGAEMTDAGAELATFLAWHLRVELFVDKDFPPPTKLWVLQALLLLEAYEKLYSSRVLHERSQIHHATTISLLRRGSALLGRSALDSPPNEEDGGTSSIADTRDPWWNRWITREATKRVAFAAFIMDSIHATMFSHTAVMVAHEMRLRLPCDDALWTANSGGEVNRLREAHGAEPISFLEGLKGTLNGRPVKTNIFGRTALMAGLLNVSFHLGQRDMQVRSLGVAVGGKDLWRGTLTKAFDIWERDWDHGTESAASPGRFRPVKHNGSGGGAGVSPATSWPGSKDEEQVFESRVVLHHLAHMGMHVDIVQCQIFAGAPRLLGRTITDADRTSAERRMREVWAPKASARDAVFYSLRFLGQVLAPYLEGGPVAQNFDDPAFASPAYSPRDDYLLNRPWVLYFAALVVWSYGFALDGPLPRPVAPELLYDRARQVADMREFMARVGSVEKPDDLERLSGRNMAVGLLSVLIASFRRCRWELMREAARRLRDCVNKLTGRDDREEEAEAKGR